MGRRIVRFVAALALLALLNATVAFADEGSGAAYSYTQTSATSATVVFDAPVASAAIDDPALASASISDDQRTVTVTAVDEAVGIATLSVVAGESPCVIEIPVGYTTFAFDGDVFTVYPGSASNYDVSGISVPEGQVPADAIVPVENADGSLTYQNGSSEGIAYALLVEIGKKGGTFVLTGTGSDMSFAVKKGATGDVTLLLAGVDLSSTMTAPLVVKKDAAGLMSLKALAGHRNRLADSDLNNADLHGAVDDGGDGTNTAWAESAIIKGKAGAQVVLCGTGSLLLECSSKNAVKIGESGSLTIRDLTLTVVSERHGLSSDNTLVVESGVVTVTSHKDAIRSDPDEINAEEGTAGIVEICGGTLTIDAEDDAVKAGSLVSIGVAGGNDEDLLLRIVSSREGLEGRNVTIHSGTVDIHATDDGINTVVPEFNVFLPAEDCAVRIEGGYVTVDTEVGDGIDSNGDLYLMGGVVLVWGGKVMVENALDYNGDIHINGARVFAIGHNHLRHSAPTKDSQAWTTTTFHATQGDMVIVEVDGVEVFNLPAKRVATYAFVSVPEMTTSSRTTFKLFSKPIQLTVKRIAGDYATQTSALVCAETFDHSEWVVLARDDDFADALGAVGLAGALDAPIVLTDRHALSDAASAEIGRLGATKAYVIGGPAAMETQLESDLRERCGIEDIVRLWGNDNYDTSLVCAQEIERLCGPSPKAIVAMSMNFQDVLSMSPFAYKYHVPVVLQTWGETSADRGFTDEAAAWLAGKELLVAGGVGAVSVESVEPFTVAVRLASTTGYGTSDIIARWMVEEGYLDKSSVVIASGAQAFKGVDALAGSALAGKLSAPLLLVNANNDVEQIDYTTLNGYYKRYKNSIETVYLLGGYYVLPLEF